VVTEKKIGRILSAHMIIERKTVRELAKEIGISSATISRITRHKDIDGKTMISIIKWLFD